MRGGFFIHGVHVYVRLGRSKVPEALGEVDTREAHRAAVFVATTAASAAVNGSHSAGAVDLGEAGKKARESERPPQDKLWHLKSEAK